MNGISKKLLGLAGGAAALALIVGISPASAGFLTLNTAALNGPANLAVDPGGGSDTPGTFTTDGGKGWANLAVILSGSTGNETAGTANYTLLGAVNIDNFTNVTLGTATRTGVGNDGNNWVFFTTVRIDGTGTWTGGKFSADPGASVSLDLWGAQGGVNVNNFAGAAANALASGLDDFANLGFSTAPPICYQGSALPSQDCVRLATTVAPLAGTGFTIDDSAQESKDNIAFTIATQFGVDPWAGGSGGFFPSPPDPSTFGLIVISGCELVTPQPVSIGDRVSNVFVTASAQSGAASCGGAGQANEHDPVGWAFATAVPEPASLAILGSALLGFGLIRRRRNS